jgi:hypothetical protein
MGSHRSRPRNDRDQTDRTRIDPANRRGNRPNRCRRRAAVGGLLVGACIVTAFAGVLTDPLRRGLRLHQRRLHRILDVLEADFHEAGAEAFVAREIYAARLLDLVDIPRVPRRGLA